MDEKILDWVTLAEKFSASGDPKSMRTVAREIFEVDKNSADGLAIMAESSLYLGNLEEAESLAEYALSVAPNNLRGRLVMGGVAVKRFQFRDLLKIFDGVIDDAHDELKNLQGRLNDFNRKFAFNRREKTPEDKDFQDLLEKKILIVRSLLFKALCWSSNGLYLAGEPERAATFVHRIVFRATGESAEMALSDWLEPSAPGGDIGERTAFNYVSCTAYYVRGPEDIKTLSEINLATGKGAYP